MTQRYRITPRARDDLAEIGRYTSNKWGTQQRNRYLKNLELCFVWLAEHPHSGAERPDICPGYHCYPQGEHLIFYLVQPHGIDVIGIPHQRRDVVNYF